MARRNYEYDENYGFRKERHPVVRVLLTGIWWFLGSIVLACVYHLLVSLVWNTPEDRRLFHENRLYEKNYPALRAREKMLRETVRDLERRDDEIYLAVFNTSAPSMSDISYGSILPDDENIGAEDIFGHIAKRITRIESSMDAVEDNFRRIFERCSRDYYTLPPMTLPLENFNVARTGASTGSKISPFFKVAMSHDGIDLIAPVGTPVVAAGSGVVVRTARASGTDGNIIVIDHGNGYTTRYAHLSEIRVSSGAKVRTGDRIGTVGTSGKSFAPHLHYSVYHGKEPCDPVNYFFASVDPQEYATMLILSSSTGQAMD